MRVQINVGAQVQAPALAAAPLGRPRTVVAIAPAQASPRAEAAPSGVGALVGEPVGGLLGNQVGKGSGRTAATVAGLAAGAWVGHEAERTLGPDHGAGAGTPAYDTTVRFDIGGTQTIRIAGAPRWRVGQRVSWNGQELGPAR